MLKRWDDHLAALLDERYPALVSYARMLTQGDLAAAEDLVHDALIKVFVRNSRFASAGHAEGYVRRAIVSIFIDGTRSSTRRRRAYARSVNPESAPGPEASVDLATDVENALAKLSPRERACIVLRYFDDLTVPQVARQLGIADGTAKRYLSDASAHLAATLGTELPTVDTPPAVRVEAPRRSM
jgi:RNA polymerase sigma factor (sigma-70 family)